jgi:hypothetical protein
MREKKGPPWGERALGKGGNLGMGFLYLFFFFAVFFLAFFLAAIYSQARS